MIDAMLEAILLTVLLAASPSPDPAASDKADADAKMRGVTISCFRNGPGEWDAPIMAETMRDVQQLGANCISFHPYARIEKSGEVRFHEGVDLSHVLEPLADAKRLKMKVMLIPHIGYWGSGFSWRGDIAFEEEAQWQRFFADYTRFIVAQAKMAEAGGADVLCIGLEYKKTVHREKEWRAVIKAVREVYHGKITYGANWDEYESVPFWDAVDYIGIQAYFPLVAKDDQVTDAALGKGWDRQLKRLRTFSRKHDKPILLTELGYPTADHAASEPWLSPPRRRGRWRGGNDDAAEMDDTLKRRCMAIALAKIDNEPTIHGVFLWKWFPTTREVKWDFGLQYPAMREVLREQWGKREG